MAFRSVVERCDNLHLTHAKDGEGAAAGGGLLCRGIGEGKVGRGRLVEGFVALAAEDICF